MEAPNGGIKSEESVLEAVKGKPADEGEVTPLPLLQLVQQLLRNSSTQTLQKLQDLAKDPGIMKDAEDALVGTSTVPENSMSLDLLLRFQRLLVAKIFSIEGPQGQGHSIVSDTGVLKPLSKK